MRKFSLILLLIFFLSFEAFAVEETPVIDFGIGYAHPLKEEEYGDYSKMSKIFSGIGIHSTKINIVTWEQIEPKPPKKGVHKYNWKELDKIVSIFQKEGYRNMEVVIQASSPWAMRDIKWGEKAMGKDNYSLPPTKDHWKDYTAFITNVVERYDGDGKKDMPGLLYPILHYEIESEAQGSAFWRGSAKEYIQLLQTAYKAAKQANPKTKIILSGFWLGDVVTPDEPIEKRIKKIDESTGFKRESWLKYSSFFNAVLQQKDFFDAVEFHALENYTTVFTAIGWLKKKMTSYGYQKPIWVGDCIATPTFHYGPISYHPTPFPLEPDDMVKILASRGGKEYDKINAWYRSEQSRLLLKKTVAAIVMGAEKINMGFFADNLKVMKKKMMGKLIARINPLGYNWSVAGLLSVDYKPYPAFYTYKLTIEKLRYAKFIKKLPLAPDIYGFEFSLRDNPLYVLWSEKNTAIDLPVTAAKQVKITSIITDFGKKGPKTENKDLKAGKVKLELTTNPIFVEPHPK
jgi:hypothetical protein